MSWNIESEIQTLAGAPDLKSALARCGMLKAGSALRTIRECGGWRRGGAETYILEFVVVESNGEQERFLAKALVAASIGTPPEEQLRQWTSRRARLAQHGCPVSRWFLSGNALIIEEFLPTPFEDVLRSELNPAPIWLRVVSIVDSILRAGFRPRNIIPNLRCKGDEIAWVDFGEDLGPVTAGDPYQSHVVWLALSAEYSDIMGRAPPIDPLALHIDGSAGLH